MKLSYAEVADLEKLLDYLGDCDTPKLDENDYFLVGMMQGKMARWLRENG